MMILTKELVDIVQLDFLNKVLMFCKYGKYLESSYATDFHKFLWSVEATYLVKFRPFFRKYKMKYLPTSKIFPLCYAKLRRSSRTWVAVLDCMSPLWGRLQRTNKAHVLQDWSILEKALCLHKTKFLLYLIIFL